MRSSAAARQRRINCISDRQLALSSTSLLFAGDGCTRSIQYPPTRLSMGRTNYLPWQKHWFKVATICTRKRLQVWDQKKRISAERGPIKNPFPTAI
eukprot:scaffold163249_cov51-Attheya_sp.AAC.3